MAQTSEQTQSLTGKPTPKCPACEEELTIGYTEHGTLTWDGKMWSDSDRGSDADYYCLKCDARMDHEELEELGVF